MAAEPGHAETTAAAASMENIEALLQAARYDDIEDIESLVSLGVSLDSKDSLGRTGFDALIFFSTGFILLFTLFIISVLFFAALHMASANGHLDVVEYLVGRGVDLNASNEEKNTPLHWACLNKHIEVVKKLILAGANVSVLNCHERTPMDDSVSRGKMEVIDAINTAVAVLEVNNISVS